LKKLIPFLQNVIPSKLVPAKLVPAKAGSRYLCPRKRVAGIQLYRMSFLRKQESRTIFWIPASAGMTAIFLDSRYPPSRAQPFAGITKRGGNGSLIIFLLYYFSTFWEMILNILVFIH